MEGQCDYVTVSCDYYYRHGTIRRIALASTLSFFSSSGVCRNYIANYFMFNIYYFFFHFFIFCCSFLKSKNEPLLRKDDIFFLDTKLRNSSKQKILFSTNQRMYGMQGHVFPASNYGVLIDYYQAE